MSEDQPEVVAETAEEPKLSAKDIWQQRERKLAKEAVEALELASATEFRGQQEIVVSRGRIVKVLEELKTDSRFQFARLMDITAVDYLKQDGTPERFAVLYELFSLKHNARLRLRVWVDEDDPNIPTASRVFSSANWGEREIYDMFGLSFVGHPNLERILLPADFGSFPLRKDYPLRGRGERDDFPRLRRGEKEDL